MSIVGKEISRYLRELADKFDAGTTDYDEEQAIKFMQLITHVPMTKEEAAMHLHIWPSRFDTLVREGKIPKGRKIIGFKEKRWYLDEIQNSEYAKSLTK